MVLFPGGCVDRAPRTRSAHTFNRPHRDRGDGPTLGRSRSMGGSMLDQDGLGGPGRVDRAGRRGAARRRPHPGRHERARLRHQGKRAERHRDLTGVAGPSLSWAGGHARARRGAGRAPDRVHQRQRLDENSYQQRRPARADPAGRPLRLPGRPDRDVPFRPGRVLLVRIRWNQLTTRTRTRITIWKGGNVLFG